MSSLRQPKISASLRTPLRVHFENVSSLGDVLKVTEERARRHLVSLDIFCRNLAHLRAQKPLD